MVWSEFAWSAVLYHRPSRPCLISSCPPMTTVRFRPSTIVDQRKPFAVTRSMSLFALRNFVGSKSLTVGQPLLSATERIQGPALVASYLMMSCVCVAPATVMGRLVARIPEHQKKKLAVPIAAVNRVMEFLMVARIRPLKPGLETQPQESTYGCWQPFDIIVGRHAAGYVTTVAQHRAQFFGARSHVME